MSCLILLIDIIKCVELIFIMGGSIMINKRWALSIFVVVVLIFMVGLSGCDMGSRTITEIEEAESVEESKVEATVVVIPEEYSISGYKFNADTNEVIGGWEIKLYESNENWEILDELAIETTNPEGFYKFTGLEEGYYLVKEVPQDNWEQVNPSDPDYYKIILPDDANEVKNVGDIDFKNAPLYSISGYKIDAVTGAGIEGWEIEIFYLVDDEKGDSVFNEPFKTDEDGYYIFEGLRAGEYRVEEEDRVGWEAVGLTSYDITLPAEGDASEPGNYGDFNFENKFIEEEELECFDDTIWAADGEPGATRFVNRGNWGTYVEYEIGAGAVGDPVEYTLYAGQYHEAGTLEVYDDNGNIFVRYLIGSDEDDSYKDGYCGSWSYLTEYHLQVVNNFSDFDSVRTRQGNPIPGQFEYSEIYELEDEKNDTGWLKVEGNFNETVYIAAHGVAQWCGYLCETE